MAEAMSGGFLEVDLEALHGAARRCSHFSVLREASFIVRSPESQLTKPISQKI